MKFFNYLIEAIKIKKVSKPDFMTSMGLEAEYSVTELEPNVYQIAKFTHGKEPSELYRCTWTGNKWKCNCYSKANTCKHIKIVRDFVKGKKRSEFQKWIEKKL